MTRYITTGILLTVLLFGTASYAQDDEPVETGSPIDGVWVTEKGNLVEVEVNGTDVRLYFPEYALRRDATLIGQTLVYITHYNDPMQEEIYLSVPESERGPCEGFVHRGDERHRFTLNLSDDGMVLRGIKEINVMVCEYDTDENGFTSNHRPVGYQWTYHSDYQWRRTDCDFSNLPPLDSGIIERYELVGMMLENFGLIAEFSLGDFEHRKRITFSYDQAFIDSDTGEFVTMSERANHPHIEPLDGRVYLDGESGKYEIELYPYAMSSHSSLLTGLTLLCHQVMTLEESGEMLEGPTTQMEIDAVEYVWSHRNTLCSNYDDLFDHHIDYLSRALRFRALDEN